MQIGRKNLKEAEFRCRGWMTALINLLLNWYSDLSGKRIIFEFHLLIDVHLVSLEVEKKKIDFFTVKCGFEGPSWTNEEMHVWFSK